jgi:hypothetical protein
VKAVYNQCSRLRHEQTTGCFSMVFYTVVVHSIAWLHKFQPATSVEKGQASLYDPRRTMPATASQAFRPNLKAWRGSAVLSRSENIAIQSGRVKTLVAEERDERHNYLVSGSKTGCLNGADE